MNVTSMTVVVILLQYLTFSLYTVDKGLLQSLIVSCYVTARKSIKPTMCVCVHVVAVPLGEQVVLSKIANNSNHFWLQSVWQCCAVE